MVTLCSSVPDPLNHVHKILSASFFAHNLGPRMCSATARLGDY